MDLCLGIITALIVGFLSIWLFWRKRRMSLFQRYGIPGPKPSFWTGNLNEYQEKSEKCSAEWIEKYGKFIGFYLGAKPFLITVDPEFIKIMQVKEFKNFVNKDLILPDAGIPHKSIMKALELLYDEEWKNMRSYLSAAFSTGKIKKMSHIMIGAIDIFLKNIKQEEEKTFDILNSFKKLTFDIISKAAFGINTDVQNGNTNTFIQSIYNVFETNTSQVLPAISICFPELEPIPTKLRSMIDAIRNIFNLASLRSVIRACEQIIESRKGSENLPSDLLQSMIAANVAETDKPSNTDASKDIEIISKTYRMSNEELIGNAVAFMAAGYDTTSSTLGYCSYLLAENPEAQEKARAEIIKNFPPGEEIDYAGLANLQYLEQVISESLRLYPLTLTVVNRVCAEDFKYKDITIPKGAVVIIPTWNLQRDPKYWSEPEKFIPERFSPEKRGSIDPFIYQPFGAGPRICIGMRLATTVIKLTLANLLRNYRLETDKNEELELEHTLFLIRPKNGIRLRAVPLN